MRRKLSLIICLSILAIMLWAGMATIDYMLSTKAMTPIFAQNINASDAAIYRGIGYTVIIDDGYVVSHSGAELKGYFYWGWR